MLYEMNFQKVIEWKFRSSENWEYTGTRDSSCVHEYGATATASNGKKSYSETTLQIFYCGFQANWTFWKFMI